MVDESDKDLEKKYALRFGQIAQEMGFVTAEQVREALDEQLSNSLSARLRPRRLIGEILFEKGWMTLKQIETVLSEIFKEK
jgi:hypothetical protein